MFRRHSKSILVSMFLLSTVLIAGSAAAQQCDAKVNAAGAILSFGGTNTAFVNVQHIAGTGVYDVCCFGNYNLTFGLDSAIANSTAESANFGVTNNIVFSANVDQICTRVWNWPSPQSQPADNAFYFILHTN